MCSSTSADIAADPVLSTEPDSILFQTDAHGHVTLNPVVARRIPSDRQLYILKEYRQGRERNAARVAFCWSHGEVYAQCRNGDFARAHPNLCHDAGCPFCGTAASRLWVWSSTRDREKLFHAPQLGMEWTISTDDLDVALTSARKLAQEIADSSIFEPVIDANIFGSRIRFSLYECDLHYSQIAKIAHKLHRGSTVTLHRNIGGMKLLEWTFLGTEPLLRIPGDLRSMALLPLRGRRLLRTTGKFYSPLSKAKLAERRKEESEGLPCACKLCGGIVDNIPKPDRPSMTIEELERVYKLIDWSSNYQRIFKAPPSPVIAIRNHSDYIPAASAAESHAPPS